jgi:hypothetical protein
LIPFKDLYFYLAIQNSNQNISKTNCWLQFDVEKTLWIRQDLNQRSRQEFEYSLYENELLILFLLDNIQEYAVHFKNKNFSEN